MSEVEVKNQDSLALIQHAQQQLSSCRLIEEAIDRIMSSSTNGNFEYFPVVLGRRQRDGQTSSGITGQFLFLTLMTFVATYCDKTEHKPNF